MYFRCLIPFISLALTCVVAYGQSSVLLDRSEVEKLLNPEADKAAMRLMSFGCTTQSLGVVKDDEGKLVRRFDFVNSSDSTLTIRGLHTSCGCLEARSDKTSYQAGEKGSITLVYSPERMAGGINVRAFVYTELNPSKPTAILSLTGEVAVSDKWSYLPVDAGALRMKSDKALFQAGEVAVRILCANVSDKLVRPELELVPEGMEVFFEPAEIAPGQESDLVVRRVGPGFENSGFLIKIKGCPAKLVGIVIE